MNGSDNDSDANTLRVGYYYACFLNITCNEQDVDETRSFQTETKFKYNKNKKRRAIKIIWDTWRREDGTL